MDRVKFLELPAVEGFIQWLVADLPVRPLHLLIRPSRYVPGGADQQLTGIESILEHYMWRTSWPDHHNNGFQVLSGDWSSTVESLQQLKHLVRTALNGTDENEMLSACLAVLKWGGVIGAIPFLNRLREQGRLIAYFLNLQPLFKLDSEPSRELESLDQTTIERFDAGLTKIHAFLDDSGSPIYDSRVGAAMAMLYQLYQEQQGSQNRGLKFPSGAARGDQIRNPGDLGFDKAPQFFTPAVPREDWARWQLRLGWILRATLARTSWFNGQGGMANRCHAFEACLFMIGYDLRCFIPGENPQVQNRNSTPPMNRQRGWVPTGHTFPTVISFYLEFRQTGLADNREAFRGWLVRANGRTEGAATAICFPLRQNEFDLFGCNLDTLQSIDAGGPPALAAILGEGPFVAGDEREYVCLVDVWITGQVANMTPPERNEYIVNNGWAGTVGSASTLLCVGTSVGRHFGLLDENAHPTPFYDAFFCNFIL